MPVPSIQRRTHPLDILFFIDRYYPTDHTFIQEVYTRILPQKGYRVTIVARSRQARSIQQRTWGGARLILLPSRIKYLSDLKHTRFIRNLMAGGYDIIQVRNDPVFALLAPRQKYVFQLSHLKAEQFLDERHKRLGNILKGAVDLFLRRLYIPRARVVLAVSKMMQHYLQEHYQLADVRCVPLGIGEVRWDPDLTAWVRRYYRLAGKTVFIYIGTMDQSRRLDVVLAGFKAARQSGPMALLMVGDAPNAEDVRRLKEQVRHEAIDDVHFIDRVPRSQVPAYIRAADIGLSVIPVSRTYTCSSPTKPIEYLQAGLPILITPIPDQLAIVAKSGSGRVCDFSPAHIAAAMRRMASADLPAMGARGRRYVEAFRDYQVLSHLLEGCYRDMVL